MKLQQIKLLGEAEDCEEFPAEHGGVVVALSEEEDLGDEFVVGSAHGHRAEQLLQVVRQLLSAPVALARRVQRDEDATVLV